MTSKEMLGQLMDRHYADAMRAKEEGRLVAWAPSISPQELLETMDITVVYPENHAAAIGDSENDLEMLNAVALPIAMGNASAAVKNLCLRETLTNAQDGVAAAIDRIIAENG